MNHQRKLVPMVHVFFLSLRGRGGGQSIGLTGALVADEIELQSLLEGIFVDVVLDGHSAKKKIKL